MYGRMPCTYIHTYVGVYGGVLQCAEVCMYALTCVYIVSCMLVCHVQYVVVHLVMCCCLLMYVHTYIRM